MEAPEPIIFPEPPEPMRELFEIIHGVMRFDPKATKRWEEISGHFQDENE